MEKERIFANSHFVTHKPTIKKAIEQIKGDLKKQIKAFYEQSKNKQKLYSEMLNDRLFERLTEFAKVKVVEESTNELRKKQAA